MRKEGGQLGRNKGRFLKFTAIRNIDRKVNRKLVLLP